MAQGSLKKKNSSVSKKAKSQKKSLGAKKGGKTHSLYFVVVYVLEFLVSQFNNFMLIKKILTNLVH